MFSIFATTDSVKATITRFMLEQQIHIRNSLSTFQMPLIRIISRSIQKTTILIICSCNYSRTYFKYFVKVFHPNLAVCVCIILLC